MGTLLAIITAIIFLGALLYYAASKNAQNRQALAQHVANGDIEPHVIGGVHEYTFEYHKVLPEQYQNPKVSVFASSYKEAKEKFSEETGLPESHIINPVIVK